MAETFETFITEERERLAREREAANAKIRDAQAELANIERQLKGIQAYETAMRPGSPRTARTGERSGSRRTQIIAILRDNPDLDRGELLEKMGLKGDERGSMSVSNALTNLVKANQIARQGRKYRLVS